MKKVAVLLTCHDRKEKTLRSLRALYYQNGVNVSFLFEVYLVDDGSTDGTYDAVKNEFSDVTIIKGDGNLFWNRGMHLAWSSAIQKGKYDYFLWLNDDTILFENAFLELLYCSNSVTGPTAICGANCSEITKEFSYGGADQNGSAIKPNGVLQSCSIIEGNCVLINNEAFRLVGMLDPIFPHAIGDHDYGLRLLKAGGKLYTTREYIGFCERNEKLPMWCYGSTPMKERFKSLYSPLGYAHPTYFYIYEKRHFGMAVAIKHYFSIHLRALAPYLWK